MTPSVIRPILAGLLLLGVSSGTALTQGSTAAAGASAGARSGMSAGCSNAGDPPTGISVTVDGTTRTALVHTPPPHGSAAAPVVLSFHGYGSGSYDQEYRSGLSEAADARGFIAVYPQGQGVPPTWDLQGDSDTRFVASLLDALEAVLCIDTGRVFASGFSMGGGMANVTGCRLADRITAIGTVSANHGESWGDPCAPARPVALVAFHGMQDSVVPYAGGVIPVFPEWADRPVTAVEEWAGDWARTDGCTGDPVVATVAADVESLTWRGCVAPVVLYRITDGGHTWPGGQNDPAEGLATDAISATDLMLDAFAAEVVPGQSPR